MNIYQSLTEKPWLVKSVPAPLTPTQAQNEARKTPGTTAVKFFIAVVCVVFFLFSVTYLSRSQYPDFQALAGDPWLPLTQPSQLWINTGALLLASLCLHLCAYTFSALQQAKQSLMFTTCLILAFIFSIAFVLGQYQVWQQLSQQGFLINSNPANSYFYLLTGMHGLHLIGGILALIRLVYRYGWRKTEKALKQNLTLCAWYWHYLLLLWLFLFALLTAAPSTYKTIAAFCGF